METGTKRLVDATMEVEVELRLPSEVDMEPEDNTIYPGAVELDVVGPDPGTQH